MADEHSLSGVPNSVPAAMMSATSSSTPASAETCASTAASFSTAATLSPAAAATASTATATASTAAMATDSATKDRVTKALEDFLSTFGLSRLKRGAAMHWVRKCCFGDDLEVASRVRAWLLQNVNGTRHRKGMFFK